MSNQVFAKVHIVFRESNVIVRHTIIDGAPLPWLISKRMTKAYSLGLQLIQVLDKTNAGNLISVTISDGKRALASWRTMSDYGNYFTYTHDVHPMIKFVLTH